MTIEPRHIGLGKGPVGLVGPHSCRELTQLVMIPSRSGTVGLGGQAGQHVVLIEGEKFKVRVTNS